MRRNGIAGQGVGTVRHNVSAWGLPRSAMYGNKLSYGGIRVLACAVHGTVTAQLPLCLPFCDWI